MAVAVSYAVMYHSLEALKKKLELDAGLTWHSFRIGSATRTKLEVRRSVGVLLSRELLLDFDLNFLSVF